MFNKFFCIVSSLVLSTGAVLQADDHPQEINMCEDGVKVSLIGSGLWHTVEIEVPETYPVNVQNKWVNLCVKDPTGKEVLSQLLGEGSWMGATYCIPVNVWQFEKIFKMMQEANRLREELSGQKKTSEAK